MFPGQNNPIIARPILHCRKSNFIFLHVLYILLEKQLKNDDVCVILLEVLMGNLATSDETLQCENNCQFLLAVCVNAAINVSLALE